MEQLLQPPAKQFAPCKRRRCDIELVSLPSWHPRSTTWRPSPHSSSAKHRLMLVAERGVAVAERPLRPHFSLPGANGSPHGADRGRLGVSTVINPGHLTDPGSRCRTLQITYKGKATENLTMQKPCICRLNGTCSPGHSGFVGEFSICSVKSKQARSLPFSARNCRPFWLNAGRV